MNDTLLGGLGATQKVGEKREGDKEILTKFFTQDIKWNINFFTHDKVVYIIPCTQLITAPVLMVVTFTNITYPWAFERKPALNKITLHWFNSLKDILYLYTFSDSYNKSSCRTSVLHSCELIRMLTDGTKQKFHSFCVLYLFFLQHLLCWSGHHCESPQLEYTFCQEWAPGNATLSGLSSAMFLSVSHLGCKDSAHRSQHLLLLDPRWTTDCLSCFGWMPWDQQPQLVLKKKWTNITLCRTSLGWGKATKSSRTYTYPVMPAM